MLTIHRICIALIICLTSTCYAEQSPEQTVHRLFDAMREHDGNKLAAQFMPSALLQRAQVNGEVKKNDIGRFAEFVSSTEHYLDEKLLAIVVHISDNLAVVWTPYVFYLDTQLSHCGVNSFQLIKLQDQWKIQYLIDNTHSGDCAHFIEQHSNQ